MKKDKIDCYNLESVEKVISHLETTRYYRSAWDTGVDAYCYEMIENLKERSQYEGHEPTSYYELKEWCLNGALGWLDLSYGGNYLIYDTDIAKRLCTKSELKRTDDGEKLPNKSETWLDVQARALRQAFYRISHWYDYE